MAYSTQDDILKQISETELIQLTDDFGAGIIDAALVTDAIEDADAEIDGYVGTRYTVPMSPVPAILKKLSVDIAIYSLFSRRTEPDPHRKDRYQAAVRLLENVSAGRVSLGSGDPDGTPAASNAPQMSTANPTRVFSRDNLEGW